MTTEPSTADHAETKLTWSDGIEHFMRPHDTDVLEWHRVGRIALVLDWIGRKLRGLHWTSLPGGGGIALTGARVGLEPGSLQLEINNGDYMYVCKPLFLACVALWPDSNEWSYFELRLDKLRARDRRTGLARQERWQSEIWAADFSRSWAKHTRLLNDRVIICSKGWDFCDLIRQDGGKHNSMTRAQFRKYVLSLAQAERLRKLSEDDDDDETAVPAEERTAPR
jgi:hypothetical protein